MNLIIGGAYQGKLDYVKNTFDIKAEDVYTCDDASGEIDFSKNCIYHVERFVLYCVRNGIEAADVFKDSVNAGTLKNSVIICEDIFCGVVPVDADLRAWREMTGRLCIYLSNQAVSVTRIFCGLPQILKEKKAGEKRIYFIRHGRTLANEQRIYCGVSDYGLSKTGAEALEIQRDHYKGIIPVNAKYFTSGMKRTNQTLEILFGESDNIPKYDVVTDFREINFGVFEEKPYDSLIDDPRYIKWISGDYESNVPPDGESGNQMSERIIKAWEQFLLDNKEETDLVVVCHAGTIYYTMRYLFPEEGKNLYAWEPKNGCGYMLTLENGRWSYEPIGIWLH